MDEVRYIISEASKRIGVKTHVLRYWEDELDLVVNRNEMGHRYYKDEDIELLKEIKNYKDQGFQLKAIKLMLPNIYNLNSLASEEVDKLNEELSRKEPDMSENVEYTEQNEKTSLITNEDSDDIKLDGRDKMIQFKELMNHIIKEALRDNSVGLSSDISEHVVEGVSKEVQYLMRIQDEKVEENNRKLIDMTIREQQRSRGQAAAALEGKVKKKSKFFKKNQVHI